MQAFEASRNTKLQASLLDIGGFLLSSDTVQAAGQRISRISLGMHEEYAIEVADAVLPLLV